MEEKEQEMSPPSGYNPIAKAGIHTFLSECGRDCVRENPTDVAGGVAKENATIERGLTLPQFKDRPFERATLVLTKVFYELAQQSVADGMYHDTETALKMLPEVLANRLGAMHLADDGTLTTR